MRNIFDLLTENFGNKLSNDNNTLIEEAKGDAAARRKLSTMTANQLLDLILELGKDDLYDEILDLVKSKSTEVEKASKEAKKEVEIKPKKTTTPKRSTPTYHYGGGGCGYGSPRRGGC